MDRAPHLQSAAPERSRGGLDMNSQSPSWNQTIHVIQEVHLQGRRVNIR